MDGDSDFVVTVGLMLDATSKLTKVTREWEDLQRGLVKSVGGGMVELKGSKLYEGAGKWKKLPRDRHEVIDELITWLCDSGFKIAIAAVDKSVDLDDTLAPVTSHELLAAFHVALQVQKANQGKKRNKGVTFLVLDESKVRDSLIALISEPPAWADAYYRRGKKAEAFDTLIHTSFFVRSEDIALVQLADLVAYIYRRILHLEARGEAFDGEGEWLSKWQKDLDGRLLPTSARYPKNKAPDQAKTIAGLAPQILQG